jgi:ribosomal protein L20
VNEKNKKVLDVAGGRDTQRNNIGFWRRHNKINQQFDIIYADEMPKPVRKGQMDSSWGLRVNAPFHIVSGLADGRYLQNLGRQLVIKTPNGLPN